MIDSGALVHYGTIGATIALGAAGIAIGEGIIATQAMQAQYDQPHAHREISRISFIAMALTETAAILALTIMIIMFLTVTPTAANFAAQAIARLGIMFAVGCSGFAVGIVSAMPAGAAAMAVARQPLIANKIMNIMLLTMTIIQTPIIFGFLVGLLIHTTATDITTTLEAWRLCAAGIAIGIGAIGPVVGQGIFARVACTSIGIRRQGYKRIVSFALFSQALIETPILLACLISFMLIGTVTITNHLQLTAALVAACTIGIGTTVPGIAAGLVAARACQAMTDHPEQQADITRTSLLVQTFLDTLPIYCLIISLTLLLIAR